MSCATVKQAHVKGKKPDMSKLFSQETPTELSPHDAIDREPTITRQAIHSLAPVSCRTVMLVLDHDGYLTPVYTAGDLLRWCKATWRAEQD